MQSVSIGPPGCSLSAGIVNHIAAFVYRPTPTDLARAFPDTTIILDHFGGPLGLGSYAGQRETLLPAWRQDITELAACPNVVAKLGGVNMPINGFGWRERERGGQFPPVASRRLASSTKPACV